MAHEQQTTLSLDQGIQSLAEWKPSALRTEPKLWVQTLEVHKEFPNGNATLLRRINLRKGLNILWATDRDDPKSKLGGHGAGKSTFCRLLRYAIGDPRPGTRQFRENFRSQFPRGWVLAEVWLAGELWLVARPLGLGQHPFAVKGQSIADGIPEKAEQQKFKEYEAALEAATLGGLSDLTLSGSGSAVAWEHVLPWLTRDQDAHYASLIDWRPKDGDSENEKTLSVVDRENLLRILLGFVDPTHQENLRKREQVTQEHERLVRERPHREYHRGQCKKSLQVLYPGTIGLPGELTFEGSVSGEVARLRAEADAALNAQSDDPEVAKLTSDEAALRLAIEFIEDQIAEISDAVAHQQGTVRATEHRASDAKHLSGTTRFLPFKGYCSTPLEIARNNGCPCVTARPDDDEVEQKTSKIIESVGPEKGRLAQLQERLRHLKTDLEQRKKLQAEASDKVLQRRRFLQQKDAELNAPRNRAASLEAAYQAWIASEESYNQREQEIQELSKQKDALDSRIEADARSLLTRISKFETLFNLFVQALLGKEVEGRVKLSGGKTIEPILKFNGVYDSAAINLTKLLSFDLAALALSLFEGEGFHPGFLLHDSPREADLAATIYGSLFEAAVAIERICGGNCGFQYIVTTTEPAPQAINQAPWLLHPILNAAKAEERFLGINL